MTRPDPGFWSGKRVLVTGHTGFKGAWLCLMLHQMGARISGLALPAAPDGAFAAMRPPVDEHIADITDAAAVACAVRTAAPEIVLHLAAQALVGEGHRRPVETFATNVMGTAHLLAALEAAPPSVALVVTSDKVYGAGDGEAFREDSPLRGTDPYSASKVAAETVAACWRQRLRPSGCSVATARAGNVLGGGDIGADRLAPDVIRAFLTGKPPMLRQPDAVRPWQYVLDVISGYLLYVQSLVRGNAPRAQNFGPSAAGEITVAALVGLLQRSLGGPAGWQRGPASFAETTVLRLNPTLARETLGWRVTTDIETAVRRTADWHLAAWRGEDMARFGRRQIEAWWNPDNDNLGRTN